MRFTERRCSGSLPSLAAQVDSAVAAALRRSERRGGCAARKVFDDGDIDAGIWTVGTAMGLINDIPTVAELVSRMVTEAAELINVRLAGMVATDDYRASDPAPGTAAAPSRGRS